MGLSDQYAWKGAHQQGGGLVNERGKKCVGKGFDTSEGVRILMVSAQGNFRRRRVGE